MKCSQDDITAQDDFISTLHESCFSVRRGFGPPFLCLVSEYSDKEPGDHHDLYRQL
jgi:hypothetical protein